MSKDYVNRYEKVVISAREARRLNEVARISGRELKIRPTALAWTRLVAGKIKFSYEDPEPFEQEEAPAKEEA